MNLFSKRITKKQKASLIGSIRKNPPPFFGIFSNFKKEVDLWFQFLEKLALTGFLVYISEKTHNIALRILVYITLIIWFVYVVNYSYIFYVLVFKSIVKKSNLWWQFVAIIMIAFGALMYFITKFTDLFYILH